MRKFVWLEETERTTYCEEKIFDTLEEAIYYGEREWEDVSYKSKRRIMKAYKNGKRIAMYSIYEIEIPEDKLALYEEGELEDPLHDSFWVADCFDFIEAEIKREDEEDE